MSKTKLKSRKHVWEAWKRIYIRCQEVEMKSGRNLSLEDRLLNDRFRRLCMISMQKTNDKNEWMFEVLPCGKKLFCLPTEWHLFELAYTKSFDAIHMAQTDPMRYKLSGESSLVELFLEMLDTEVLRLIQVGELREAELLRAWIREADGYTVLRTSDVAALASYLDSKQKEIERQKEAGKALHDLRQKNKAAKEAEAAAKKAAEEAAAKQAEAEAAAKKAPRKPSKKKSAAKRQKKS